MVVDLTSKGFYTSGKELGSMKGELGCAKSLACDDEVDEVCKEANGDEFPAPDDDTLDTYLSQYRLSNLLPIFIVAENIHIPPTILGNPIVLIDHRQLALSQNRYRQNSRTP
ncbi:hypothetical protein DL95DRAFT_416522 [Leptodontidium sp. 2 PMI_412]|nr:hypothetical protein DL95DRAFT_416522 [Leptodontidium sp. 2 PMI_412]